MNINDNKRYKGVYILGIDTTFVCIDNTQITAFEFPDSPYMPQETTDTFRAGGFWWGYRGYSPTRLSYAILLDYTESHKIARKYCEAFQFSVISKIYDKSELNICGVFIKEWLGRFIESE